jgi:pantoate--beta-alanine ligase
VIRGMVRQLDLPIAIIAGETVREPDGLAMSSRNNYLSAAQRNEAPHLYRVLQKVRDGMATDEAVRELSDAGWRPDYIEVRRRSDLAPRQGGEEELVVLGAARLGATRLIDNLEF